MVFDYVVVLDWRFVKICHEIESNMGVYGEFGIFIVAVNLLDTMNFS